MANKISILKSDIAEMQEVLNESSTPADVKKALEPALKKAKEDLAKLEKEGGDKPEKKESAKAMPAKKSNKSADEAIKNCRELLAKYQSKKANDSERIAKRTKAGKPATLTPAETVNKSASKVKSKIVTMKKNTDEGLKVSEINKLSSGIIATIKSTLEGINTVSEKHKFLNSIQKEIIALNKRLPKAAKYGMYMAEGGSIADSNIEMLESNVHAIKHHADEIENLLSKNIQIEAWVNAKAERASTDLSDITHYLDGLQSEMHMADGGQLYKQGMLYALTEHISSGDIANITDVLEYENIDRIRRKAIEYYQNNGDKPYSFNELERVLNMVVEEEIEAGVMARGGCMDCGGYMEDGGEVYDIRDYNDNLVDGYLDSTKLIEWAKDYSKQNNENPKITNVKEAISYIEKNNGSKGQMFEVYTKYADGGYMADGGMMAKGGAIAEYKIIPNKIGKGSTSNIVFSDYEIAFNINGSQQDAEKEAKEFVKEHNETHPSAVIIKIHPSGQPIKNKKVSYVTKDEITKYEDGGYMADGAKLGGGRKDWGDNLGDGFHVGDDVHITDSKSMFKGKTGFVSGVVGGGLFVTLSDNGNERNVVVSKKGVEKLNAHEYGKGGYVVGSIYVGTDGKNYRYVGNLGEKHLFMNSDKKYVEKKLNEVTFKKSGHYKSGGKIKRTKAAILEDKRLKAKHAGHRTTAWGTEYTENRENRSDKNRRDRF
jgi:hypothetical protein